MVDIVTTARANNFLHRLLALQGSTFLWHQMVDVVTTGATSSLMQEIAPTISFANAFTEISLE